jgi:small subunit ribosomal protein S14
MKYLKIKNKKVYRLYYSQELKQLKYKYIFNNIKLPGYMRQEAFNELSACSSFVKIKRRCFITNKSRSVSKLFKISRIKLRTLVSNNFINGVKKLS